MKIWPKFEGSGLSTLGVFWINCLDTQSAEWVLATVAEVSKDPRLGGLDVRALRDDACYKVSVVFPYVNMALPPTVGLVLERLRKSNLGLDTSKWVPISVSKPSPNGWFLILRIDDSSVSFLKSRDFRLSYFATHVFFKDLMGKVVEKEVTKPAN